MFVGPGSGIITLILVLWVINIILAFAVANYARNRGFPFAPVLVGAIFVSVPLVWFIVAVMPAPNNSRY